MSQRRHAFTLIELIVVVLIILLIMAMLIPTVLKVREVANKQSCAGNLRKIAIASHNYHNDFNHLPAGYYSAVHENGNDLRYAEKRGPHVGVLVMLLPYLEQDKVYQQLVVPPITFAADMDDAPSQFLQLEMRQEHDAWWKMPGNLQAATGRMRLEAFQCPSDNLYDDGVSSGIVSLQIGHGAFAYVTTSGAEQLGRTSYVGVAGAAGDPAEEPWRKFRGILQNRSPMTLGQITVLDGTSYTLLFGESLGGVGVGPRNTAFTWMGAGALGTAYGLGCAREPGSTAATPPALGTQPAPGTTGAVWYRFSSRHQNVVQFVYAAGFIRSVRFGNTTSPDMSRDWANQSDWATLQQMAGVRDGLNWDVSAIYE